MDDRVIEPVASESVDLVDDAVPDRVSCDVVEHFLQRAATGGLRGLAGLDELLDDDCAELFGLALGGFSLGGDGQTFFEAVAGGLVLGGDPQVGDRWYQPVSSFLTGPGYLVPLVSCQCAECRDVDAGGETDGRHGVTAFQVPNCGLGVWGAGWRSRQDSKRTPPIGV
ncbi:hypothetical protein [Gordonia sp. Swx-4]|uniref:hypothetical protein n=1 Tax=uncultured Microbacterium sp. TaxID=191216 RepID=UPI0025738215|nr:hypothetical protein [Gordonia sp. Swx-4]WJG12424.1 hypothetical protein PWF70_17775 [Gordonia sp. Swx-4]